jgi:threonine aldolase
MYTFPFWNPLPARLHHLNQIWGDLVSKHNVDNQDFHLEVRDLNQVQTEWQVMVDVDHGLGAEELHKALKEHGVLCLYEGHNRIRVVTHYQITEDDVHYALACFQAIGRKKHVD